jgi:hypothetical protein
MVLTRVSPLTAVEWALPSFYATFFLMICSVSTLLFVIVWQFIPHHTWDTGKLMSISLREGIFTGLAVTIMVTFQLLQLANWWILLLVALVFISIELAMKH